MKRALPSQWPLLLFRTSIEIVLLPDLRWNLSFYLFWVRVCFRSIRNLVIFAPGLEASEIIFVRTSIPKHARGRWPLVFLGALAAQMSPKGPQASFSFQWLFVLFWCQLYGFDFFLLNLVVWATLRQFLKATPSMELRKIIHFRWIFEICAIPTFWKSIQCEID